jgi:hypothetical protein
MQSARLASSTWQSDTYLAKGMMWHIIWMTAVWFQDQANTKLSLPVTTFP